ncbi:FAD-binding oxidoreductase [Saccharothrix obliqua]|uniref:FAD-binding oxidoreductase n=1 Tax=Saccharothrix obliqua TaxID=2861747 RepID=UPI001C5F3374|nr:FAD-binding oxidoreductase [Saccharothrix obliqua]MBW4717993.1 FAD-binding oxidoreductase [Saccharothrix obliqua]
MTISADTSPRQRALRAALDAAADIVGADRVEIRLGPEGEPVPAAHRPNVSEFRSRDVPGVIAPRTVDEVRQVVRAFAGAGRLHPVSTGRNWGLGSAEPARDDAVVLRLDGLDRVRDLDTARGWAVVEPGVTQGGLARLLTGTDRLLNLTASSAHTSVVGNALDRGVGLRRQRVDDVLGLEVVLADGTLAHVGWWPDPERPTSVYRHGLGPSLAPLFLQSDLGVVTAAAVHLPPRAEARHVLRLSFAKQDLVPAIDRLRRWSAQGLVSGVLKVFDFTAAEFYGGAVGGFLAHVCVEGTTASAAALADVVRAEAAGLFTEEPGPPTDLIARTVAGLYAGDPALNDEVLAATLGHHADDVDRHGEGWLFFLPMVPFTGADIRHALGLLDRVLEETGVRCGATLNALGPDLVDFVVPVKFRRTAEESARAHRALDRVHELFAAAGYPPYRLDVDHADLVDRLSPDPAARDLARRLKSALDPTGTIAPGRYA